MAKIINTKVSEKADFKIEDGVIRDSSIGDWSKVYIYDMSELKCEVIINEKLVTAKFHIYSDVWTFSKHNFLDFIKDYYELQGGAH